MSNRSTSTKTARKLERLYQTKEHGTKHTTVLRLTGAIPKLVANARQEERESIVAWLRSFEVTTLIVVADAIERGDHVSPTK